MDSSNATGTTTVGANLYGNEYWSPEFPFLNRMKTAGPWIAQGGDSSAITYDADGYPTSAPAGTSNLYTVLALDPVTATSDNTYVLTWTGSANFFIAGGQVISSEPGKIVFNFTRTDTNQTFISVSGLDPSNPLDNMAVVRSDQVDLYNSGEIFNPAFVSKVSQLGTLRFMDWNDTNGNQTANWSDRTSINNYSWDSSAKSGVPIEVEVALANEAKTDMWLNVPTHATDDYVRQMVTYVHDHLDPSLSLHLEYSNEVWNFSFNAAHYASDQADALWGNGQHYGPGWVTWYGYRAAQVANIANQVYGADANRLHNVLATQTVYEGLESYIVDGVARANLGSVSQLFNDYAVTTYFGGTLTGQNDADRATILGWAKEGDAGVTAAIAALKDNTGLTATDNGSLAWLSGVLAYQGAEAQKLGLNLVAYEGGIDLTGSLSAYGADAGLVTDFLNRVRDDPRMADIYTQMVADFSAAGGKLLNIYTDTGAGYGSLKSIYSSGSPEWDALVAAEAAAKGQGASATTSSGVTAGTTATTTDAVTTPITTASTTSGTIATTTDAVTTPITTASTTSGTIATTTDAVTTPITTASTTSGTIATTTDAVTTPITTASTTSGTTATTTDAVTTPITTASTTSGTTATTTDAVTTPITTASTTSGTIATTTDAMTTPITTASTTTQTGSSGGTNAASSLIQALSSGTTSESIYTMADGEKAITYVGTSKFTATANDLGDTITAGNGGSQITGGAGDDTLIGGAGDDYLDGGGGVNRLVGGGGNDTFVVHDLRDQVIAAADDGNDTVLTSLPAYVLPANIRNLTYTSTGAFQAIGNDLGDTITGGAGPSRLIGGAGNDTLIGGSGNDVLDGGAGADRMVGGAGDDTYFVDNAADQVVEAAGGGTDTVYSSIDYTLAANVENLHLIGTTALTGTGNNLDNIITANDAGNTLIAGSGNDTLIGGAGNDVLVGGPGIDVMTGGAGADRFTFSVGDLSADPANTDTITDFSRTDGDKIDLSGYHNATLSAFTFVGTGAFTKQAGQLRLDTSGTSQILYGDLNGDGVADFALNVSKGAGALIATDFVL